MKTTHAGNTLVEVMIAGTVLVFVLVAVVSGLILATKNSSYAKNQALATRRVQEGIEFFRSYQFELGWESFYGILRADGSVFSYCLNSLPSTAVSFRDSLTPRTCSVTNAADKIPGTQFFRQVNITLPDLVNNDEARIEVVVSWIDGPDTRTAKGTQILRRWR